MRHAESSRTHLPAPRPQAKAPESGRISREGMAEMMKSEWEAFGSLFAQFLLHRTEVSEPVVTAPRPQTPRSAEPMGHFEVKVLYPVALRGSRVHFSCPSCYREMVLARRQAGMKARCPVCHTVLRTPRPGGRHPARNLDREVESLLHPERFPTTLTTDHLRLAARWRQQAALLAGLAAGFVLLAVGGFSRIKMQNAPEVGEISEPTPRLLAARAQDFGDTRNRAQALVEQFLKADGWQEKSKLVRETRRVGPLMERYYRNNLGSPTPIPWKSIATTGLGFYDGVLDGPAVTYVTVVTEADDKLVFTVEHDAHGDCIEWESSVGITAANQGKNLTMVPSVTRTLPVLAALDDYYNYDFANPDQEICVRLQDPQTNELLSYGYLARSSTQARELLAALRQATPDDPQPLLLEVCSDKKSPATRQLRITRFLQSGWRTTSTVASRG